MDDKRKDLERIFKNILHSNNVYFQPPENIKILYPCIVFKLADIDTQRANNHVYMKRHRYEVTYIDRKPNSPIPDKIAEIPYTSFSRFYAFEYLNHYVYDVYY